MISPVEPAELAAPLLQSRAFPEVRISVVYRQVGPGPESIDVTWERDIPHPDQLVQVLRVLLGSHPDNGKEAR